MMTNIRCPNCNRVLGHTDDALKAELCCRGCKKIVAVNIKIAKAADYLSERSKND